MEPSPKFVEIRVADFQPAERWRIMKNILMIGFAFMLQFTAFMGASNLQSSVNADQSLGTFTLAAIYGSLIFSNIFLPVLIISWLGCKWTIAVAFVAYMPFIAAQFWPRFYTMIPAGLAVGLGGGPLWCAQCTYFTVASEAYASISELSADVLVTRFFGLFFMFYQMAQVWGNLISSAVMSYGLEPKEATVNATAENINGSLALVAELCGANFYGVASASEENPNLEPPPPERIQLIAGIYLCCMLLASLIVALGVDSLARYDRGRKGSASGKSGLKLLAVTLELLGERSQQLILPITIFIGAEQAFLFADYNAAFVSCAWGISKIGYVMICFGVVNAIAAPAIGSIVKVTGRMPVMLFAFCLHLGILVALILWRPQAQQGWIFFLVSGLWGVCDAVWLVQVNALSGILFPGKEESGYSNFKLWEATGSVITYAYSPYLRTSVKLYILMVVLIVGVTCYLIIECTGRVKKVTSRDKADFALVATAEKY
ncbi:UNC93-like protein [Copidosoma floridanum]|uniref:UNC93-like protein n=1 Tax=Copidosoma floridanum TaxID=29053 RepID=UPI0006C9A479|nr:UNC93-like protein [Copidosoma floridanum]XP_014214882.1 UNC93-like protein [Copidosoma floridanum]XP_014214883.1 UNC93-like protein [Copidosoma floridanum]